MKISKIEAKNVINSGNLYKKYSKLIFVVLSFLTTYTRGKCSIALNKIM